MMKRISLIVVFLMLLSGCQPIRESSYVAVLDNGEGQGEVLYLDDDLKILTSMKCEATETVTASGEVIYLSTESSDYQGYYLKYNKKANRLTDVEGELLYGLVEGSYVCRQNDDVCFYAKGQQVGREHMEVRLISRCGSELFIIDQALMLHCYDAESLQKKKVSRLSNDEYIGFTEADGYWCLIGNNGISVLQEGEVDTTYLYPLAFDELENCLSGRIFVYEGSELAVYRISFSGHSLKLDLELDEHYYREINIDELFSGRLAQGSRLVFFMESEN